MRHLDVRPTDVFVVSYPKSGNTWARFLLAHLLFPDETIDFVSVERLIPDIYVESSRRIAALPGPRYLKSHEYFDPRYRKVLYLVRDPRDVLVSYFHHQRKMNRIPPGTDIEAFSRTYLDGSMDHYGSWNHNVLSWTAVREGEPDFMVRRYEDLKSDAVGTLTEIATFLGLGASGDAIDRAVQASSFDSMRRLEETQGRLWRAMKRARQDLRFFRSGQVGEGKQEIPPAVLAELQKRWGRTMERFGYH